MKVDAFGTVEERLWSRVNIGPEDACWTWNRPLGRKRPGKLYVNGKLRNVPRVVWEVVYGPIPDGLHICHSCDNPPCCNPEHLYLGTPSENAKDAVARGLTLLPYQRGVVWNRNRTRCNAGHVYNDVGVVVRPDGRRDCIPCLKRRERAAYARRVERIKRARALEAARG